MRSDVLRHDGRMQALRLPPPLARYIGLRLRRLGDSIATVAPPPRQPDANPPALVRARAALADARQQMPGLMGIQPLETADGRPLETALARKEAVVTLPIEPAEHQMGLARVEELVLSLQEERRDLRSEVAALRLIAEELREALQRLDERSDSIAGDQPGGLATPDRPRIPVEPVFPSGSVGVALHISGSESSDTITQLRNAIERQPEVDEVRTVSANANGGELRVYLRLPLQLRAFTELLGRVAPSAKPLAGPTPASLLLRLRPG
jgi:hypothetical protein